MKVKELIRELEVYDKELDVKAMLKTGEPYEIVGFHIGTYIMGVEGKPFAKIVISNWDVKKPHDKAR